MSVTAAFLQPPSDGKGSESAFYTCLVAAGLLLPAALFLLWLFFSETRPLLDEYRLHKTGTVAKASEVSNVQRYNSRYSDNVDFDLRYVTEDGTWHKTHVEFDSSWYIGKVHLPVVVRYDPTSSKHFSTSYGAEYLVGRTIHVGLMNAVVVGWICFWVLGFLARAWSDRQSRLKLLSIATQPTSSRASRSRRSRTHEC